MQFSVYIPLQYSFKTNAIWKILSIWKILKYILEQKFQII